MKDLRDELGFNAENFKELLGEIDHAESVCHLAKDFYLYKRLLFIFKEYDRIMKIWNTTTTGIKDDSYSTFYFSNKIIPMVQESNKEMVECYECCTEEIINLMGRINKSKFDVTPKIASEGWHGNVLALGKSDSISKLGNHLTEFYENLENNDNPNSWISDEINRYCYWSEIGGGLGIINPIYEDFMILDLK